MPAATAHTLPQSAPALPLSAPCPSAPRQLTLPPSPVPVLPLPPGCRFPPTYLPYAQNPPHPHKNALSFPAPFPIPCIPSLPPVPELPQAPVSIQYNLPMRLLPQSPEVLLFLLSGCSFFLPFPFSRFFLMITASNISPHVLTTGSGCSGIRRSFSLFS